MELTKEDTQKAKGVAILGMVMLHLFCRLGDLPYTPWIWIGEIPLIYYWGLFGDMCIPIYCFCSGYAHYLLYEKHKEGYKRSIANKLLRFLGNYWIVVALFSAIGLLAGKGSTMPGSIFEFLGNVFLYRISYNGAWWFVVTYVFLSLLSPAFIKLTSQLHPRLIILISGTIYFFAYLFRFSYIITMPNAVLEWIWQQLILLGTSQFGYVIGMVFQRMRWIARLREYLQNDADISGRSLWKRHLAKAIIFLFPIVAFVGHWIVQSTIVAPITAAAVLVWLFSTNLPSCVNRIFLFLGKHSTNIWLVHMFFYLTLFKDFVFIAKYPVLILLFMLAVCVLISCIVNWFLREINNFRPVLSNRNV